MPDTRSHRGPHQEDRQFFAEPAVSGLRAATDDLCWLLNRGYAPPSSIKLVGDRYSLVSRQRTAVARCACSDESMRLRRLRRVDANDMCGRELWLDGYNVLTTVEAALAGGVILVGRDGCCRDMASMHGSYRKVAETIPAIQLIARLMKLWNVAGCRWLLDRPVSNSGRLKRILEDVAEREAMNWNIELVPNPDAVLAETEFIVATADSQILDRCQRWVNLARLAVAEISGAWMVDLSARE